MIKIGDEVYVHGYIDEIRNDTVIVRNKGGYFGTVKDEITSLDYHKGYAQGQNYAVNAMFDMINRLNHNGSISVKLLRKELINFSEEANRSDRR